MNITELKEFLAYGSSLPPDARSDLARTMCGDMNTATLSESEKVIAFEILKLLAKDVETEVRRTLSEQLKTNADLPHDIAMQLAQDHEDEVAMPVLEFSKVLTDEDLIEIIHSTKQATRLVSVARREDVPAVVTSELIHTHVEEVAEAVFANKTADVTDEAMEEAIQTFKESENVMGTLVARGGLKPEIAEKIVSVVSGHMQERITKRFGVLPKVVQEATEQAHEKATIEMIATHTSKTNTLELVNHLYNSQKLSHSVILRALCHGDIDFFEAGLSKLAGIPMANARTLLYKGGQEGFQALFKTANMPENMVEAAEVIFRLTMEEAENTDKSNISHRITERIMEQGYDESIPNMRYLTSLISNTDHKHTIH